ncbi:MAG TPA: DUF932 domain-containing protein [bacterium]|nr:DUF932 domain-containing protein [bacterium]
MSKLIPLGEVYAQVERASRNCWDNHVPVKQVRFEGLDRVRIQGNTHPLRPAAQRAIAYRLGIPLNYLEKCDPGLQAVNLNAWLEQERNENLFFRFDGDSVRAIFTPRYIPIDNKQVVERLFECGFREDMPAQCSLDEEFMLLNLPDREKGFLIKRDDRLEPGIGIGNSEVGLSSLTLSAFVLRLVCTNGLIAKTALDSSYRHVSHRILDEFPAVLQQLSTAWERQRGQWALSAESYVENPEATLKTFNRQFQLGKTEEEAVFWAWPREAGNTLLHIINTYTKAGHYPTLPAESIYRLQRVGGNILSMLN